MSNTNFSAEIIADSINEKNDRLTTFLVTFPRMILAEFNTHRMLSRNSASSRAIPFETMLKRVEENPFIPLRWMKDHKGMQGNEYFSKDEMYDELYPDMTMHQYLKGQWLKAKDVAVLQARTLSMAGLTKQFCNRLLEPFMWHTVIATASELQNFFALRVHEAAEIHMQEISGLMLKEYNMSTPKSLKPGEWHIPFGDQLDEGRVKAEAERLLAIPVTRDMPLSEAMDIVKTHIAVARCARLSYLNYEGKDDYTADLVLHENLAEMGHWSPFEHVARSMTHEEYEESAHVVDGIGESGWSGNFRGFVQYRKTFENENRMDPRVKQRIYLT